MKLRVTHDEARRILSYIVHKDFQKGMLTYWWPRDDGSVPAQTVAWLFCWAKTGLQSPTAMQDAHQAFDRIFDVPFHIVDARLPHALAKEWRKDRAFRRQFDEELEALLRNPKIPEPGPLSTVDQLPGTVIGGAAEPQVAQSWNLSGFVPDQGDSAQPGSPATTELERLRAICSAVDDSIWQFHRADPGAAAQPASGQSFPSIASRPGPRIRRQETQAILCQVAEADGTFTCSVQSPASASGSVAQSDLIFYRPDGSRALSVQLTVGSGASLASSSLGLVRLIAEPSDAMWFAVVESTNDSALQSILQGLWAAATRTAEDGNVAHKLPMTLVFHLTVLGGAFSLHRAVILQPGVSGQLLNAAEFAAYRLPTRRPGGGVWEVVEPAGWAVRFAPTG